MPRFSLTISDLSAADVARVVRNVEYDEAGAAARPFVAPVGESERPVRVKRSAPAALPAAPAAAVPAPTAPSALASAATAHAPAPTPSAGITVESLTGKARTLGTGPLKQMALLATLSAIGQPSLNKIPPEHYGAFDRLLDAAVAYSQIPGASLDGLKNACSPGQYEEAIVTLNEVVSASMGL